MGVGGKLLPPPPPGPWPSPQSTVPAEKGPYLKHGEEGLGEVIERAPPGLHLIKVELPPEELHAQEGEDDDEEKQQQKQGGDGAHRVQQGRHQVAQGVPVPGDGVRGEPPSPLAPLPHPPGALGPAATTSSWPCPWGSVVVGPGWPAHN